MEKAPEDWRTPGRFAPFAEFIEIRACVLALRAYRASIDQYHRDGAFDGLDRVGRFLAPGRDRVKTFDALQ